MNIERLNKAASAAGFAMATPDDEPISSASELATPSGATNSKALVLASVAARNTAAGASLASWLRAHLPTFGWRAPA